MHATRFVDEDISGAVGIEEHGIAVGVHRIGDGGVEQGTGVEHVVVDREVDDGLVGPGLAVVLGDHGERVVKSTEHRKGDRVALGVDGIGVGHETPGKGRRVQFGEGAACPSWRLRPWSACRSGHRPVRCKEHRRWPSGAVMPMAWMVLPSAPPTVARGQRCQMSVPSSSGRAGSVVVIQAPLPMASRLAITRPPVLRG